jgi:hypothetical protein
VAAEKRIVLTMRAVEAAMDSLLGIAVDFTPELYGHDPQTKFGIITTADIKGNDLYIEGFLYAGDFPTIVAEIEANRRRLGFSFQARDLMTTDPDAEPVPIIQGVFTGAASCSRKRRRINPHR